jgi:hypothetical protein
MAKAKVVIKTEPLVKLYVEYVVPFAAYGPMYDDIISQVNDVCEGEAYITRLATFDGNYNVERRIMSEQAAKTGIAT